MVQWLRPATAAAVGSTMRPAALAAGIRRRPRPPMFASVRATARSRDPASPGSKRRPAGQHAQQSPRSSPAGRLAARTRSIAHSRDLGWRSASLPRRAGRLRQASRRRQATAATVVGGHRRSSARSALPRTPPPARCKLRSGGARAMSPAGRPRSAERSTRRAKALGHANRRDAADRGRICDVCLRLAPHRPRLLGRMTWNGQPPARNHRLPAYFPARIPRAPRGR
jgi:hypothetical protein